ncbi:MULTISPECIES: hypothetical protein [Pseudobutyrivibrio]|uniref:Uncharacterized protein n=1 Tax=Pseudobutyrivibrio xylanivorans TaxID=185007 RepID=A0A1G5RZA5_PSEXY|nr:MULTISPECIES: hypothetical protein [Pseudobutyrivibrio]QFJ55301.1 hypothetical protein FXF36_10720 [Pseudobutyrivibrio xylanivorans]SCZ79432.1 hypothetical protein SAMN02910350_01792 [Pseudobutyrivibrio xylanivorans]SFI28916.1 hypothetical protein SAMN04487830_1388 [Pseudobutyrivibrio sp. OR37]
MLLGNMYILTGIVSMMMVDCHFGRGSEVLLVLIVMLTEIFGAIFYAREAMKRGETLSIQNKLIVVLGAFSILVGYLFSLITSNILGIMFGATVAIIGAIIKMEFLLPIMHEKMERKIRRK